MKRNYTSTIEAIERRVLLSAGLLDTTFGTGGKLSIPSPGASTIATTPDVVVQADGFIDVLAFPGQIRQLKPDGSLNTAYGNGGIASVPASVPSTLLLQSDGKLLIVGSSITRLTTAGKLDTTFAGGKGFERAPHPASGAALQKDGKILAYSGSVYRFNTNGSPDTTYGVNGVASYGGKGGIAVDAAGGAVVSFQIPGDGVDVKFGIERLTSNGVLDKTFGVNGLATDDGDRGDTMNSSAVAIAPNGTIYLASNYEQGVGDDTGLISVFNAKGAVLGFHGVNSWSFQGGVYDLAVQPDNKLVTSGSAWSPTNSGNRNISVMRFLAVSGPSFFLSPDPSFNGGKAAQVDYFTPDPDSGRDRLTFQDPATGDFGSSVALQPNGKIVVAGYTFETVGDTNTIVANKVTVTRLTGDGGSISGTLFNDQNANGNPESTEPKVAGRTVYIDANNNSKLDSGEVRTQTDAAGRFTFANLQAGTFNIREVLPTGWRQTAPNGNGMARVVNLGAGQNATIMQIGATNAAVITGKFYNDLNRNGVFNATETGLAHWQAYIDKNNNGIWDKGEYIVTADSKGNYTMVLQPGTYRIREVRQAAWIRTQPAGAWPLGYYDVTVAAGQLVATRNFGNVLG